MPLNLKKIVIFSVEQLNVKYCFLDLMSLHYQNNTICFNRLIVPSSMFIKTSLQKENKKDFKIISQTFIKQTTLKTNVIVYNRIRFDWEVKHIRLG
jgi:hypothetical protein